MRGTDETSGSFFSHVDLEARLSARHPLRKFRGGAVQRAMANALASLDAKFEVLYATRRA